MKISIARILFTLAVAGIAARSEASTLTIPPGLNPGDKYRLVFVTSDGTTAASTNIADYNSFVTSEADAVVELFDLGATWTVIGSTDSVSAATNIGTTFSGIYTLDGNEVATSTAALFNTGATMLLSPIDINQNGSVEGTLVWTGTGPDGQGGTGDSSRLGDVYTDAGPYAGNSSLTTINGLGWLVATNQYQGNSHPLYAISSEITVTPEPNTVGLAALGGAMLLLAWRRKQQNHIGTGTDRSPAAHD